ncbi:hypothetical protein [Neorhodopirellula pilleata]|uniref:Uncharacterized protein n=1 Tax=Neorhodopirellula pilleata TaxID=2714738 RepID=A0A5C6AUF3_9BACT|nr:hypothetical protein [Neorhodopirellula pilleata]TWU03370.1 hypothetical protein Pla100_02900 [Neorhodopirellula pilleata]
MRQQNQKIQLLYLFLALGCAVVLFVGCDDAVTDGKVETNNGQVQTEYTDQIEEDLVTDSETLSDEIQGTDQELDADPNRQDAQNYLDESDSSASSEGAENEGSSGLLI